MKYIQHIILGLTILCGSNPSLSAELCLSKLSGGYDSSNSKLRGFVEDDPYKAMLYGLMRRGEAVKDRDLFNDAQELWIRTKTTKAISATSLRALVETHW
ncbi:MAG TPA: hypothetical protein VEL47_03685, partial [Myxococcota bacterium]|nr:hypothetical protein [Myxococcota bacterium]